MTTTPVIELALLRISSESPSASTPPTDPLSSNAALRADLTHALGVLHSASGYPFHLLQQHEDPSVLYILGAWPSVAAHEAFLPSAANQALLSTLAGRVSVAWMQHLAPSPADLNDPAAALAGLLNAAPVVAIGRHGVRAPQRAALHNAWTVRRHLLEVAGARGCVAGWRTGQVYGLEASDEGGAGAADAGGRPERDDEELVLLSGWADVAAHGAFAATAAFDEYAQIREHVATFDVRHARWVAGS